MELKGFKTGSCGKMDVFLEQISLSIFVDHFNQFFYTHEYQWRNAGMTVLSRRRSGLLWAFCWCAQDLRRLARLVEKDFDLSPVLGQAQASVSAIS